MTHASFKPNRIAVVGTIGVAVAIAISSLTVVRAQRFVPLGSVSYSCSSGRACVTGKSTGQEPWGVLGVSTHNNGVEGESSGLGRAGVAGVSFASGLGGIGVYGESADTTGKYAAFIAQADKAATNLFYADNVANKTSCVIDPNANLACTGTVLGEPASSNAGVIGIASSNFGVLGTSGTNDGVHGLTASSGASGVAGIASSSGYGISGSSSTGTGVSGNSTNGVGVSGSSSTAAGVSGFTSSSTYSGVDGVGPNYGVAAYSTSTSAAPASVPYAALFAEDANSSSYIFEGFGGNCCRNYCVIDYSGNLKCTGTITGGQSPQTAHRTSSGQHVLAYGLESTSATIEDFGSARTVDGSVNVRFEPHFASTIDANRPYYVFLTPLGDTRGLYISAKEPASFEVREVQGGHSRIAFDYRIVAHPLDAKTDRLPLAPALRLSAPLLPRHPRDRR